MTNFGTLAILALPEMPMRQLRFLLALETVTRGKDNWREVGTPLLAKAAGLSPRTVAKARDELVASGVIKYRRGNGRGHVSTYRMPGIDACIDDRAKVATSLATFDPAKGGNLALVKVATQPDKGGKRNAVTSGNSSGALGSYALEPSALSGRAHGAPPADRTGPGPDDQKPDKINTHRALAAVAREELDARGVTLPSEAWYGKTVETVLGEGEHHSPEQYLRAAIRNEPDPKARFGPITRPGYS